MRDWSHKKVCCSTDRRVLKLGLHSHENQQTLSMFYSSGSSSVLLKQLVAFAWLDNVCLAFLRKKAPVWWWREMMYVWGKMKSGEHPPARDASTTTSSVSGFPRLAQAASQLLKLCSSLARPCSFLYPEPALLSLIKLIWVAWLMMELSAQLHMCCHSAESLCCLGSLMEQSLIYSISAVWVSPPFGVWWRKLSKAGRRNLLLWLHDEQ